ncbi:hypothetical protein H4R33_000973 [Dimargaris cristalligena]|nr:hypothetical protein H4R33_000973 [Dimargaris cristalligena]
MPELDPLPRPVGTSGTASINLTIVDGIRQLIDKELPAVLAHTEQRFPEYWVIAEDLLADLLTDHLSQCDSTSEELLSTLIDQKIAVRRRYTLTPDHAWYLYFIPKQPVTNARPTTDPAKIKITNADTTPVQPVVKRLRTSTGGRLSKPFRSPLRVSATQQQPAQSAGPRTVTGDASTTVRTPSRLTPPMSNIVSPKRQLFGTRTKSQILANPTLTAANSRKKELALKLEDIETQLRKINLVKSIIKQNESDTLEDLIVKWRTAAQDALRYLFDQMKDINPETLGSLVNNSTRPSFQDNHYGPSSSDMNEGTRGDATDCPHLESLDYGPPPPSTPAESTMSLKFLLDMMAIDYSTIGYDEDDEDFC